MEITDKIKDIIKDKLNIDDSEVVDTSKSIYALGADSLDKIEIIIDIEKEFNMSIPDDNAEEITESIDSIVEYVTKKLK